MSPAKPSRPFWNPFIAGQLSFLLGIVSVGLMVFWLVKAAPETTTNDDSENSAKSTVNKSAEAGDETAARLQTFAMSLAIAGVVPGVVGLVRERPPFLPIVGLPLCLFALFFLPVIHFVGYWVFAPLVMLAIFAPVLNDLVIDPIRWIFSAVRFLFGPFTRWLRDEE